MQQPPESIHPGHFKVQPHWFLWVLCTCMVTLSAGYLCGVEFLHHGGDGTEAVLISIGYLMIYPVFLVKLAWGTELSRSSSPFTSSGSGYSAYRGSRFPKLF